MQQPPISPDGHYWWDGNAWQPMVTQPPAVSPEVAWAASAASAPMGRWARGWRISKLSWAVVRSDRELLKLAVLSFVGFLAMAIVFAVPALALTPWVRTGPADWALAAAGYICFSFVSFYFNAAMIAAAMLKLQGQPATAADGLRVANSHAGKILQWAVVSATVGLVIRQIERRLGVLGLIGGMLLGLAWAVATSFIVPVLIFEQYGMYDSFKRSASIVKQRWGEQIAAGVSVGAGVFLWVIGGLAISAVLFLVSIPVGVIAAVATIIAAMVVGSALSGVYKAALYQFAATGQIGNGYGYVAADFEAAFRPRRGMMRR